MTGNSRRPQRAFLIVPWAHSELASPSQRKAGEASRAGGGEKNVDLSWEGQGRKGTCPRSHGLAEAELQSSEGGEEMRRERSWEHTVNL